MSEGSRPGAHGPRVRVTGPPRRTSVRSRLGDVHEQTDLGDVYLRSLLREQFGLAAQVLVALAIPLGLLPLAVFWWPRLTEPQLVGIPVAWVVLGLVVYPYLVLLGRWYVRRVERNEQYFADLVSAATDDDAERDDHDPTTGGGR